MSDVATVAEAASAPVLAAASGQAAQLVVNLFGYNMNVMAVSIGLIVFFILVLFWRIQRTDKLDFADLITKDGRSVSLTKVLQLIGGMTATWIMVKLTLTGGLTEALFGLYLTYVGAIEGYSKFVAAKYNYNEKSVKDASKE